MRTITLLLYSITLIIQRDILILITNCIFCKENITSMLIWFYIRDIKNFTITGVNFTIICTLPASIIAVNVTDLKLQNILLNNCGKNQSAYFNSTYFSLEFLNYLIKSASIHQFFSTTAFQSLLIISILHLMLEILE